MRDGVMVPILARAWERPTIGQLRYYMKHRPQTGKSLIGRYGEDEFNQNMRAITGDSLTEAFAPGVVWQVDSSSTNVKVVNRLDRGRGIDVGWFYLASDVFSHMVTGVRVGLGGPSWTDLSELLVNAMTDKVSFCARHNITITEEQWPCHHVPQAIRTDRGSEYTGWNSDSLTTELGITLIETPTHRPDLKGLIERVIRTVKYAALYWLPGTTYDPQSWKKGRPKEDPCLDIEQLTYIVIQEVIAYNTATWLKKYKLDEQMTREIGWPQSPLSSGSTVCSSDRGICVNVPRRPSRSPCSAKLGHRSLQRASCSSATTIPAIAPSASSGSTKPEETVYGGT